jgi:hypothetical protein
MAGIAWCCADRVASAQVRILDPPPTIGPVQGPVPGGPSPGRRAEALRRIMLRTGAGPLRPLWSAAYRFAARAISAYLRRGHRGSSAYLIDGLGGPNVVPGISDIDLGLVLAASGQPPGAARLAVERRWARLRGRVPALGLLAFVATYEEAELRRAAAGSPCLTFGLDDPEVGDLGRALFQPTLVDPAALTIRPGVQRPLSNWRRLAGGDRRPPTPPVDAQQRRLAAWLELQHWWWYVFDASVRPSGARKAYLFVKLASEPVRIWHWVVEGTSPPSRRDALRLGPELFPEERLTFERAGELLDSIPREPRASLREFLPGFVRLTAQLAERLQSDVEAAGYSELRLLDGRLAQGAHAADPLRALISRDPALLPLVDWRALARPTLPDELLSPIEGSAADPVVIAGAAVASRTGPYPALRVDRLIVLPSSRRRRASLRSVHCPVSDPVSFALLEGADRARYPNVRGWSLEDTARRAAAEHRAWLTTAPPGAGDRLVELGMLFSAARAGLLLETLDAGRPELALTAEAVARRLGDRLPGVAAAPLEAYEEYRSCRAGGGEPAPGAVAALRAGILTLAPYRDASVPSPQPRLGRR